MSRCRQLGLAEQHLQRLRSPSKRIRTLTTIALSFLILALIPTSALASEATASWDANTDGNTDGYLLYIRANNEPGYDLKKPVWTGTATYCKVYGLTSGGEYYFIVRAYNNEGKISEPSNEVLLKAK